MLIWDEEKHHSFINVVCMHCGITVKVPVYCGNRFCKVCSYPRRQRIRDRLTWLIANSQSPAGMRLKMITLAMKNQPLLAPMIKHLVKSFRRMRQTSLWKKTFWGGAFVIEVTGCEGSWHAHIHAVGFSDYIPWEKLRNKWSDISGSQSVYIENVTPKKAVYYVSKYLSKQDSLEPSLREDLNEALKKCRLFQPIGKWHSLSRDYRAPQKLCRNCKHPASFMPQDILYAKLYSGSKWEYS